MIYTNLECAFLPCGGVVRRGVDTLLLGFDPVVLPAEAWACMSSSSQKGRFVLCGCSSWYRTSTSTGPSPVLCLFSQNLSPPHIQPLVCSMTFTFSLELMPIYPLLPYAFPPFLSQCLHPMYTRVPLLVVHL